MELISVNMKVKWPCLQLVHKSQRTGFVAIVPVCSSRCSTAELDNHDIGALIENGIGIVSVAVVDLIRVIGDVTEAKNAMSA